MSKLLLDPSRPPDPPDPIDPLLRLPEVQKLLASSASTVWRLVKRGELARPLRVSANVVAWLTSDIAAFIRHRRALRDA